MTASALDRIDAEIVRQLQEDVRMPVAAIAARIGASESTVRNRLARLLESGAVELSAWVNPEAVDHRVWVMIDLSVDMRLIDDVARKLSACPEIYFVGIATGAYDIHSAGVFRSNSELLDFMTGRLAAIEGIQRAFTSTIIKRMKRTTRYAQPERLVDAGTPAPARPRDVAAAAPARGTPKASARGDRPNAPARASRGRRLAAAKG